jgi:predicted phage baseplate assembly protein
VGRWLIISGERSNIPATTGVRASELVMLSRVEAVDIDLPGEKPYTRLVFDNTLTYTYKRDTVEIYGNVVEATHGETREEVLGSGDGSKVFQTFTLSKSPLTYTAAPTAAGVDSTLTVRVNEVRWHEADNLAELDSEDRRFITRTDNEGITSVIFGNGEQGKRLPTGVENVKALYRFGIGQVGNVAAEQIKLVAGRPLGVKGVINPLPATGGADREGPNQIRRNAALAVQALDRLVSAPDYEYFARAFAGVEKAYATPLSDGQREFIHLTIAGQSGNLIAESSQLYRSLLRALRRHGDPQQLFLVANRRLKLLFIEANVFIHPDYLWEVVAPQLRTALLDTFSFENRNLGQDALSSEVISTIQAIPGVLYVDLDKFDAVGEGITPEGLKTLASSLTLRPRIPAGLTRVEQLIHEVQQGEWLLKIASQYRTTLKRLLHLNNISKPNLIRPGDKLLISSKNIFQPAEIVYLTPDIENTLILNLGNAS